MITPKMMIINSMVIDTITAVISLQQQTGFDGCRIREPPNPLTIVKCVELAFDAESCSTFGLCVPVVIESTVMVISRVAIDGTVSVGAFWCNLFKRAKLAAVKILPENVLCVWEVFRGRLIFIE